MAVDCDHSGAITVEDLLKYLDGNVDYVYDDLKKLLKDKDTTNHVGELNFADFCQWIGPTISQSEGFYFRHDSVKNPQFDQNLTKFNSTVNSIESHNLHKNSTGILAKVLNKI